MKKIFLLFTLSTLLSLTSITFGQNEFKIHHPTITQNDTILSAITMSNRYYFAGIKAPDSIYSITAVKFSVGNHADSLGILTDGDGADLTYTPVADKWVAVEAGKFYPFKVVQPSFDSADSNYVGHGWETLSRRY